MSESYSTEERAEIERRVIEGLSKGIPLAVLCREEGMPDRVTIYRWRDDDEVLAQRIARAREAGFDAIAEEAMEIADDGRNDWVMRYGEDEDENVGWRLNGEHVQRSKLRIETRLKLLAKWDPKRYGDKTLVGSDPENPLPQGFQINLVRASDEPSAG